MQRNKSYRLLSLVAALALAVCVAPFVSGCSVSSTTTTTISGSVDEGSPNNVITVELTIDGSLGEGGATSTKEVTLPGGSTVLDVLNASDAKVTVEDSDYGPYVTAINGVAAHDSYGWTYTVNGKQPTVGAAECKVNAGDTIVWTLVQYEG